MKPIFACLVIGILSFPTSILSAKKPNAFVSDVRRSQYGLERIRASAVQNTGTGQTGRAGPALREHALPIPVCGASRASLMSGLYPYANGTLGNAGTLRGNMPDVVTMSQLFRKNGYRVGRVSKIYHMGIPPEILVGTATRDDPHSWDEVVNIKAPEQNAPGEKTNWSPKNKSSQSFTGVVAEGDDLAHADGMAASHAIDFLKRHKDKPFFLACGFVRPHAPLVAPAKYFDRYDRDAMIAPVVPENDWKTCLRSFATTSATVLPTESRPNCTRACSKPTMRAFPTWMRQAGRILDALEELGLAENTIVVFTSDHGYLLGEHHKFQKQHLFEESTRVPFIVSVPWMNKQHGKATNHITELLDLYPTLAELSGLKALENPAGRELWCRSLRILLPMPGQKSSPSP